MGRAASHVTLECALQTHPQLALVVEEVAARRQSLKDVVRQVGAPAGRPAAGRPREAGRACSAERAAAGGAAGLVR